ncbi:MAG: hypothetical protein HYZ00_01545 [Candidatus Hydrogenedentes bacterium]|nr:hypothetical protein [Candidatus Hydrogenedentota bacterium]
MAQVLYSAVEATALPEAALGGKALGLLRLQAAGAPVPPWYVIPAIIAATLPWERDPEAQAQFAAAFEMLDVPPFRGVMVRSSAIAEDQPRSSAAGRYHSELILDPTELAAAAARVMVSAHRTQLIPSDLSDPTDLSDKSDRSGQSENSALAVVLQAAVPATCSGVLFSAHPAAARYHEACLEAAAGTAEHLVGGAIDPVRLLLDLRTGDSRSVSTPATQPHQLPPLPVTAALRRLLPEIEVAFDAAVDIEWAAVEEQVWLVQARPITSLHLAPEEWPPVCSTSWFFDQRFLEPVRPITWTSLVPLITRLGLIEPLAMRGESPPEPLLYRFAGQAYVAHEAYCRLLGAVPRFLLTPDLRQVFGNPCACRRRGSPRSMLRLAQFAVRQWREPLRNIRQWDTFARALPERLAAVRPADPAQPGVWRQTWATLDALTEEFLRIHRWSVPLADYMFWAFRLINSLFPPRARIARERALIDALRLPTRAANDTLRAALAAPAGASVRARFLAEFGHRSESLDYAVPTWAELLTAANQEDEPAASMLCPEGGTTHATLVPGVPPVPNSKLATRTSKQAAVPVLWRSLRRLLEMREEQRFQWERILARQRAMLLEAGALLAERGLLRGREDIWWLHWDELLRALEGAAAPDLEALRQRQHQHYVERLAPRPGFVGPESTARESGESERQPAAGEVWRGLGVSAGRATGQALVLRHLPGDVTLPEGATILVTTALDPAHTWLLTKVQGVVTERGGLLAHAAILAREYHVPMVSGVPGIPRALGPGDTLSIDGGRGEVIVTRRETTARG